MTEIVLHDGPHDGTEITISDTDSDLGWLFVPLKLDSVHSPEHYHSEHGFGASALYLRRRGVWEHRPDGHMAQHAAGMSGGT